MTGTIIKAISGFYYVKTDNQIYECKAKGAFRKNKIKPLVGDNAIIEVTDPVNFKGNVTSICDRKSELYRPAAANAEQVLIVFSLSFPTPNLHLLDRFLIIMESQHINTAIAISKIDLSNDDNVISIDEFISVYQHAGYKVFPFSSKENKGIKEIEEFLNNKCTIIAGPSGVGKSTLINKLQTNVIQDTGDISKKLNRGKNTTRHTHLIPLNDDSSIIDTPGFTSLELRDIKSEEVKDYFPEFIMENKIGCYFAGGCSHINEPDCGVKDALCEGRISKLRYESYVEIYNNIKQNEKY